MKTKSSLQIPPNPVAPTATRKFSKARALAARYGICSRTLFRFADRNLISRFKLNARVVVFAEDEVAALFESARVSAPTGSTPVQTQKARGAS